MTKKRNTTQKKLILDAISMLYHPTCDDVYNKIKETNPNIGRMTVYRNVLQMVEDNTLLYIPIPNGASRFEINHKEHSHCKCLKCGKIIDIFEVPEVILKNYDNNHITGHSILFHGYCKECSDTLEEKKK